jgi:hypothetical protein
MIRTPTTRATTARILEMFLRLCMCHRGYNPRDTSGLYMSLPTGKARRMPYPLAKQSCPFEVNYLR